MIDNPRPRRPHPRRYGLAALALLATSAVALSACSSGSSDAAPSTPGQWVAAAQQAANAAGSVHVVDEAKSAGTTQVQVGDLSAGDAEEVLTESGTKTTVALIDGTMYVNGTAAFLSSVLSLSSSEATAHAGQWISLESSDSPFTSLAQALTVSAALQPYLPSHPTSAREVVVDHRKVIAVIGTPPNAATYGESGHLSLFVSPTAPYVPIGAATVLDHPSKATEAIAYSSWGAPVRLAAPSGAVAYSSLG